ncbi:MAG: nuclear transport factor 2 family protein [Burkholderiaceae bacterium]|nr:nuclear transport factor 2 family protein [Burkholderiaceae bacterium]
MVAPPPKTAHLLASPDDVEAQFYEALREADLDKLMGVWSDDDDIVCVHPGGPRVVGARAIRASFEAIFANGGIPLQTENCKRVHTLSAAMHNLVEAVAIVSADGVQRASVVATNVYVKTALGWRMVSHHASPGDGRDMGASDDAQTTLH